MALLDNNLKLVSQFTEPGKIPTLYKPSGLKRVHCQDRFHPMGTFAAQQVVSCIKRKRPYSQVDGEGLDLMEIYERLRSLPKDAFRFSADTLPK